jgi:hypothetical protein
MDGSFPPAGAALAATRVPADLLSRLKPLLQQTKSTEATGFPALDRILPGGGWPVGALTELYPAATGIGEFALLLPALSRLTRAGRRVALVAPPYIPYSQALAWHGVKLDRLVLLQPERPADALWAMEQTLASKSVALVVGWPRRAAERDVRRLQLAAEIGAACAVLYRPLREAEQGSPAALRARLAAANDGLALDLFKARGGRPAAVTLHPPSSTALPLRSAAA